MENKDKLDERVKISVELPTYTVEQRMEKTRELLMKDVSQLACNAQSDERYFNF